MGERLVDRVVGADQEIGGDARELPGGGEHQLAHALPVVAFEAGHIFGKGRRVHRHFRMRVAAEKLGALRADGPVAESRAFGRAGDNADMQGHVIPLVKR